MGFRDDANKASHQADVPAEEKELEKFARLDFSCLLRRMHQLGCLEVQSSGLIRPRLSQGRGGKKSDM